jgi:hypothetical protein
MPFRLNTAIRLAASLAPFVTSRFGRILGRFLLQVNVEQIILVQSVFHRFNQSLLPLVAGSLPKPVVKKIIAAAKKS